MIIIVIKNKKTKLFYATYREPLKTWRKADGYTQKDYALRNAAWHVSDLLTEVNKDDDRREGFSDAFTLQTSVSENQIDMGTEQQASDEIKKIADAQLIMPPKTSYIEPKLRSGLTMYEF